MLQLPQEGESLATERSEAGAGELNETVAAKEASFSRSSVLVGCADSWAAKIEDWLNYFGMILILLLMVMIVVEVTARYVFKRPLLGYIDLIELMMVGVVFCTLALCQRERGHIRMEMFMVTVLKGGLSYRAMEFFHLLVSLVSFGVIVFFGVKAALHAYAIGDVTGSVLLPTWPTRMLAAIGSISLCVRFIVQMLQSLTGTGVVKKA